MISIEKAQEYFNCHLLGEFFFESGESQMLSALRMAENDIRSRLVREAAEDDSCYVAAVCEQAVFLLAHKDQLTENKTVVSESIEGLGSRSYSHHEKFPESLLAPRAEVYIRSINQVNLLPVARG